MAALCALAWFFVDVAVRHPYPHPVYRYCNALTCFLAFVSIGLTLNRLRQSLEEETRARSQLAEALEELEKSTEEIRKHQANMQVVCAWSRQIQVDGKWVPLDEFLASNLHIKVSHGISPEAAGAIVAQGEKSLGESDRS
jgi:hypothetical protein